MFGTPGARTAHRILARVIEAEIVQQARPEDVRLLDQRVLGQNGRLVGIGEDVLRIEDALVEELCRDNSGPSAGPRAEGVIHLGHLFVEFWTIGFAQKTDPSPPAWGRYFSTASAAGSKREIGNAIAGERLAR